MFLLSFCFLLLFTLPVKANSALTWWEGTEGSPVISTDEECPVTVLHENLTFDLGAQPFDEGYDDLEHGKENRFTAEYTFHNPADYEVTALLSFPLCNPPGYLREAENDFSYYEISANGEPVSLKTRYTWDKGGSFSLAESLSRLRDTYIQDDFFTPELTVYEYTFRVSAEDGAADARAEMSFPDRNEEQKIYTGAASSLQRNGEVCSIGFDIRDNREIVIRVFGSDFDELPAWTFTAGTSSEKKEIAGEAEVIDIKTMSYEEYILTDAQRPADISDTDWFNACAETMSYYGSETCFLDIASLDTQQMMKWLQYELVFGPGETLVNSVSAPIYPDADIGYESPVYTYRYLFTPASSWREFGDVDVSVHTDLYLLDGQPGTLEPAENGYAVHFETLPDRDMSFRLCAVNHPGRKTNAVGYALIVFFGAMLVIGVLLMVLLIVLLRRLFRKGDS